MSRNSGAEELYVDVLAQAHVVGEIPTQVIRILIENDVVGIPKPVGAVCIVVWSDGKVVAAKPEALRTAARQTPAMLRPKSTREMSVSPRAVDLVVGIVAAAIVTDPLAIGVHVRRVGMAFLVAEVSAVLLRWMLFGSALFLRTLLRAPLILRMRLWRTLFLATLRWVRHGRRLGSALWNMLGRPALRRRRMFIMLCDRGERKQNTNRKKREYDFHWFQPSTVRVSEVFEEWMIARLETVGRDVPLDQAAVSNCLVILQYNSMASSSCFFSTYSPSVWAT